MFFFSFTNCFAVLIVIFTMILHWDLLRLNFRATTPLQILFVKMKNTFWRTQRQETLGLNGGNFYFFVSFVFNSQYIFHNVSDRSHPQKCDIFSLLKFESKKKIPASKLHWREGLTAAQRIYTLIKVRNFIHKISSRLQDKKLSSTHKHHITTHTW